MEKQRHDTYEHYTIDLLLILKSLWKRVWMIIIAGLLAATIGFSIATFLIVPTYSSTIMLYVNNSSFSLGSASFSISSSEITAAQELVKTYREILNNRTTLQRVIDKADVPYDYIELSNMISSSPSNDTEIMKVTVTTENPYESAKIANTIAEVLPDRISEIIDGASMEVVDSAIPNTQKVAPSITKYTALGLIIGVMISVVWITIAAFLDDTIYDEDYVLQTYDYPILGKVPDLLNSGNGQYNYNYNYYSQSKRKAQKTGKGA